MDIYWRFQQICQEHMDLFLASFMDFHHTIPYMESYVLTLIRICIFAVIRICMFQHWFVFVFLRCRADRADCHLWQTYIWSMSKRGTGAWKYILLNKYEHKFDIYIWMYLIERESGKYGSMKFRSPILLLRSNHLSHLDTHS